MAVRRRLPAPQRGVVDDVVVHEGAGLVELQGGAGARDQRGVQHLVALGALQGEGGAQSRQERPRALAPGQEGGGRIEELPPGVAQVGGALAPGREDMYR